MFQLVIDNYFLSTKKTLLFTVFFCSVYLFCRGQNISINTIGTPPDSSAILDVSSTDLGLLIPRMTSAQRDAINDPADGLIIYNLVDSVLQTYNGICWVNSVEETCSSCSFDIRLTNRSGHIFRAFSDSITTNLVITQTSDSLSPVSLFLIHNLPPGIQAQLNKDTINNSGVSSLTIKADIFSSPGTYPIAIQAVCGSLIKSDVFMVTVGNCYEITISGKHTNYDLEAINNLPSGIPICVTVILEENAEITSNDTTLPAFTTGNLSPLSHVGIDLQNAEIIGKGGRGAHLGNDTTSIGLQGGNGGDAVHLTTRTTLKNNGYIYAGGGGGSSVSFSQTIPIPVINNFTFAMGSAGGGGAGIGIGGGTSAAFSLARIGEDGTGGVFGEEGEPGWYNRITDIPIGPVTIILWPNVRGGYGGMYGEAGKEGFFALEIQATIPIVGTIPIFTFDHTHLGGNLALGGPPGKAIVTNGHQLTGHSIGKLQKTNIRGEITP